MHPDEEQRLLRDAAREPTRVLRSLSSRLYSAEPEQKWQAVRALGQLAARPDVLAEEKLADLLRRFFWALNPESGAVPFGLPEAIGEILAARPGLQPEFLPLLCSLAYQEERVQTGPILRGVVWALGRVGPAVAQCDPKAVAALRRLATEHPEPETRKAAREALQAVEPRVGS